MRRWWRRDYFLDLGATTTLFAAAGDPAFRSEASLLILRRGLAAPYAAGDAVRHLIGRLPPSFRLARPYRDGRLEDADLLEQLLRDRKSTRLNSSHVKISYAVFCLKKKKNNK